MAHFALASVVAGLFVVALGSRSDEVRSGTLPGGQAYVESNAPASGGDWSLAAVRARESSSDLGTVARAAAALRRSARAVVVEVSADQRDHLGGAARLSLVRLGETSAGPLATDTKVEIWHRNGATAPRVWPTPKDDPALGRVVVLTPAHTQGASDGAAWLLGCELLAHTAPAVWERITVHRAQLGAQARPGELVGASLEELVALVAQVQGTRFDDSDIAAHAARLWDGEVLRVDRALDADGLAAALFTFAVTPDALGAAIARLTADEFRTRFRSQWDGARLLSATLATTVPQGALDISRTAWERSEPAARARADGLLAAVGGAESWAALSSIEMSVSTSTATRLGVQAADSTTVRVLDGALTRIDQTLDANDQRIELHTCVVGDTLWLTRDGTLMELPAAQVERVVHGERRALPRVLARLARRSDVGVRLQGDDLALFDDSGELCRIEVAEDGRPAALIQSEGAGGRRLEFGEWEEFDGLWFPTRHREIGEREVEVRVHTFARLASVDLRQFKNPLQR